MSELRAQLELPESPTERRREAWMRRASAAAKSEGFERIAVVCGAYHTPALANMPPAKQDDELLSWPAESEDRPRGCRGLTSACVPSGYGAGIESPMWYELLWDAAALARRGVDYRVPRSCCERKTCRLRPRT